MVPIQNSTTTSVAAPTSKGKKDVEPEPEITPLVKMLQTAGPIRNDGSDKFFGMENVCFESTPTKAYH